MKEYTNTPRFKKLVKQYWREEMSKRPELMRTADNRSKAIRIVKRFRSIH